VLNSFCVLKLKYETFHHQAKQIDRLIDDHIRLTGTHFIPQEELERLILKNFPALYVKDAGWHKIVFGIHGVDKKIVLKVGTKRNIENDHLAYKRVPKSVRHQLFARIFWHTKYCLLQEYGYSAQVTQEELTHLRKIVYRYGIVDVKTENLKKINGQLKIIDVNVAPFPLPTVWKMVDETKPKLPKRLTLFIKKLTKSLLD
jgi:hypothetical protein